MKICLRASLTVPSVQRLNIIKIIICSYELQGIKKKMEFPKTSALFPFNRLWIYYIQKLFFKEYFLYFINRYIRQLTKIGNLSGLELREYISKRDCIIYMIALSVKIINIFFFLSWNSNKTQFPRSLIHYIKRSKFNRLMTTIILEPKHIQRNVKCHLRWFTIHKSVIRVFILHYWNLNNLYLINSIIFLYCII